MTRPTFPSTDLVVANGTWSGSLFENPHTNFPLSLVWGFSIGFEPIEIEDEESTPNLQVEWVPLPTNSWKSMTGLSISCATFAEPVETSVYNFTHHRFDAVALSIEEQDGERIRIAVNAEGDIDGLGAPTVSAEAWLNFVGIYIRPATRPTNNNAALELLGQFTDATGLVVEDKGHIHLASPPEAHQR